MVSQTYSRKGHPLPNLIAIIILAALGLAACSLPARPAGSSAQATPAVPTPMPTLTEGATATSRPTAAPTTAPTVAVATALPLPSPEPTRAELSGAGTAAPSTGVTSSQSAQQAIFNAIDALQKAGPYRTKTTVTSDNENTELTGEVILPDRYHIWIAETEMIIVGDKTYTKQGDQWMALPGNFGATIMNAIAPITQEMKQKMTDFQTIGPDTVNGIATMVYQYKQVLDIGGSSIETTNRVWLDVKGLPVKSESDATIAGKKTHTVQLIEYDPRIKIEAPAVK